MCVCVCVCVYLVMDGMGLLTTGVSTKMTVVQWFVDWYPQGKTSTESRFNVNGKIGWATMESAGPITLLYIMYSLPKEVGIGELPWGNWTMAGCYVS